MGSARPPDPTRLLEPPTRFLNSPSRFFLALIRPFPHRKVRHYVEHFQEAAGLGVCVDFQHAAGPGARAREFYSDFSDQIIRDPDLASRIRRFQLRSPA